MYLLDLYVAGNIASRILHNTLVVFCIFIQQRIATAAAGAAHGNDLSFFFDITDEQE